MPGTDLRRGGRRDLGEAERADDRRVRHAGPCDPDLPAAGERDHAAVFSAATRFRWRRAIAWIAAIVASSVIFFGSEPRFTTRAAMSFMMTPDPSRVNKRFLRGEGYRVTVMGIGATVPIIEPTSKLVFNGNAPHDRGMADWRAVAAAVRSRRTSLGLRQDELEGVSRATVERLEAAARDVYSDLTLRRAERALGWPAGTIDRIAAGEVDVQAAVVRLGEERASEDARVDRLEESISTLTRLLSTLNERLDRLERT